MKFKEGIFVAKKPCIIMASKKLIGITPASRNPIIGSVSVRNYSSFKHSSLPTDSFQLLPDKEKPGKAEDLLFHQLVKDMTAWWASPRYDGIKRSYSVEDVVSKSGSLLQSYPSSTMGTKLFNLVKRRQAEGEPIHTSKAIKKGKTYKLSFY